MLASIPPTLSALEEPADGDTVEIGIADPTASPIKAGQGVRRLSVSSILAALPDDAGDATTVVVDPTAADGSGLPSAAPSTVLINLGGADSQTPAGDGQTVVIQSPGSDPSAVDAGTLVVDAGVAAGSEGPAILVVDLTTGETSSDPQAPPPNVLVIDAGQGDAAQSGAVSDLLTQHANDLAQAGGLDAVNLGMLDLLQGGVLDGTGRTTDAPLVLVLTDAGTDPAKVQIATDGAGLTAGQLQALQQRQPVPEDQLRITVHSVRDHVVYRLSYQIQLGRPFETEQVRVDMQFANRTPPAGLSDPRQPALRRRALGIRMRGSAVKRTHRTRVPGRTTTEGRNTTGQAETTARASRSHGSGGGGYETSHDSVAAPATVDLPAEAPSIEPYTTPIGA